MTSCCRQFEEHCRAESLDGFQIHRLYWSLPYEVRAVFLRYAVGEQTASVIIHYCPWCGRDLETTKKPDIPLAE